MQALGQGQQLPGQEGKQLPGPDDPQGAGSQSQVSPDT